jgi:hypothetical protein
VTVLFIKFLMVTCLLGSGAYQFHCARLCEGPELATARQLTRFFGLLFLLNIYFVVTWGID